MADIPILKENPVDNKKLLDAMLKLNDSISDLARPDRIMLEESSAKKLDKITSTFSRKLANDFKKAFNVPLTQTEEMTSFMIKAEYDINEQRVRSYELELKRLEELEKISTQFGHAGEYLAILEKKDQLQKSIDSMLRDSDFRDYYNLRTELNDEELENTNKQIEAQKEFNQKIKDTFGNSDLIDTFLGPLRLFTEPFKIMRGDSLFSGIAGLFGGKDEDEDYRGPITKGRMKKVDPGAVWITNQLRGDGEEDKEDDLMSKVSNIFSKGFGGGAGGMMAKLLPGLGIAGIVAGLVWMAIDGIRGFFAAKKWGVSSIAGGLGGALGGMDSGLSGAFKNMGKFALIGAGIGTLVAPIVGTIAGGLIGAAIGGIFGYIGGQNIAKGLDKIGASLNKIFDFSKIFEIIIEPFKNLFDTIFSRLTKIFDIFKDPDKSIGEKIGGLIGNVTMLLTELMLAPFKFLFDSMKSLTRLFSTEILKKDTAGEEINNIKKSAGEMFKGIIQSILNVDWISVFAGIGDFFIDVNVGFMKALLGENFMKDLMKGLGRSSKFMKSIAEGIPNFFISLWEFLSKNISRIGSRIIDKVVSFFSGLLDGVGNFFSGTGDFLAESATSISEAISGIFSGMLEFLEDPESLKEIVDKVFESIVSFITSIFTIDPLEIMKEGFSGALDVGKGITEKLGNVFKKEQSQMVTETDRLNNQTKKTMKDMLEKTKKEPEKEKKEKKEKGTIIQTNNFNNPYDPNSLTRSVQY